MRKKKYDPEALREHRETWLPLDLTMLDDIKRNRIIKRQQAVDMYTDGYPIAKIIEKTGIYPSQMYRDIDACISMDKNGNEAGYSGLLRNTRDCAFSVEDTDARQGSWQNLLFKYPTLASFIAGNWFGDKKYTDEKNMSLKSLHTKFLKECRRLGVKEYEYPFNTDSRGYKALRVYVRHLESDDIIRASYRLNKDNRQKALSTGYGNTYTVVPVAPYSMVQIDGHVIDCIYSVEVENPDGTSTWLPASRCWVIAVVDVATRCILGYSMTPERNYDSADVLAALRNAIEPKQRPDFKRIPQLDDSYPENGGFPDTAFPELHYPLFDSIMLDNAKSHLSKLTVDKVVTVLGCCMNFGSVATPETRGIIERMFGTIERGCFHRLPMTTGSSSTDLKRHNAEKNSAKYHFTYEDIQELMAYSIAVYNNSAHSSLNNETPIQALKRKVGTFGMYPRLVSENDKATIDKIHHLTDFTVTRKVCGKQENGRRPYVEYEGVVYRGNILSSTYEYSGRTICLQVDADDISKVRMFDEDGRFIEKLYATGQWRNPHSLKTRRLARALARAKGKENSPFSEQIPDLEQDLKERSKKSKKARTRSNIIRSEKKQAAKKKAAEKENVLENEENIEEKASGAETEEIDTSQIVIEMSNQGMNTMEIIKELKKRGIQI